MSYQYVYTILEEDGVAVLDFEKFPEILCEITPGDVEEDQIRAMALDAVKNALQARIDYNDVLPPSDTPAKGDDRRIVTLSPLDVLKLSLYAKFLAEKCTKTDFAKRASVTPTGLVRAFDLFHASRFDVLIDIFEKLGWSVSTRIDLKKAVG